LAKNLYDAFSIRNGLKQGYVLLPLLLNFTLEYAINKFQELQEGLELNGTHQLMVHAADANTVGLNTSTVVKNTETCLEASEDVGLAVNIEKSKYMFVSRNQNIGQNHKSPTINMSFENMAKFKYLGITVTNQNCIHDEIKSRLNSDNSCYHLVQSLASHFLSKT
jgi:hypothetical protein